MLIAWPDVTRTVVAIVLGIGLLVGGVAAIIRGWTAREERADWWWSIVYGVLLIAAAIVLWSWPDITVLIVAFIVGVAWIIAGLAEASISIVHRDEIPNWGLGVAFGVVGIAAGTVVLVWPDITVRALAIVFGIFLILAGISYVLYAVDLQRNRPPQPT